MKVEDDFLVLVSRRETKEGFGTVVLLVPDEF